LFKEALNTIKEKNLAKLGLLMDINHSLLYSLGVSNEDVEKTVFELRRSCYGAKVCGGGHGGLVIGLAKDNPDIKIKL
jgi:mevalonate kinase